ncbi:hypothetical protein [Pseudomonas sp. UM16]|uniref:hypothetical protein n=1 Tax=Pseudomonas sp. UM16 TaxID=3158962 RepID=UPI00399031FC
MIVNVMIIYFLRMFLGGLVLFLFAKYSTHSEFAVVALAFTLGALLHVMQDWGLFYSVAEAWKGKRKFYLKSLGLYRVRLSIIVGFVGVFVFLFILGGVGFVFWICFMLQSVCIYVGYYYRLSGGLNKERSSLVWAVVFFVSSFSAFVLIGHMSVFSFAFSLLFARLIQLFMLLKGFPLLSFRFFSLKNLFGTPKIDGIKVFLNYGLPMFVGSIFVLADSLVVNFFIDDSSAALYQYGYRFVSLAMVFLEILVFLFYSKIDMKDPVLRGGSAMYLGACASFLIGSYVFFTLFYGPGSCYLFDKVYCQAGEWGEEVFLVILLKVIMSACSVYMLVFCSGWQRIFPGVVGVVSLMFSLLFFMGEGSGLSEFYKVVIVANLFAAFFSVFLFVRLSLRGGVKFV